MKEIFAFVFCMFVYFGCILKIDLNLKVETFYMPYVYMKKYFGLCPPPH